MILEKKTTARRTIYWRDTSTGKEYGRVNMGLAWPGKHPGFAVVLAEDEFSPNELHYYVLAEIEESSMTSFLRSCYELVGLYALTDIYGDTAEKVANEFLRSFNEELRERRQQGFHITPPPMFKSPNCFELCVRVIQKHTEAAGKTLHLGEKSRLPGYLLELRPSDLKSANACDHPAIAALGYALTPMDIWTACDPEESIPQQQETDYDPFEE